MCSAAALSLCCYCAEVLVRPFFAGLVVPCPVNTYNGETGQTFATACALCPLNSVTTNESSTSIDDCLCIEDFYDTIAGPGVHCAMCPVGTACKGGATIDRLPVRPGYFRLDNRSIDLRKCPDASINCDDAPVCEKTTSGCQGGTDSTGDALCHPHLTGFFCGQCADHNLSTRVYYRPATKDEVAGCSECQDTLGVSLGIGILGAVAFGLLAIALLRWYRRKASATQKEKLQQLWLALKPVNKLKILTRSRSISQPPVCLQRSLLDCFC